MRRIHCTVDSNEDFYGLPVRTLVHDKVKFGPVDVEVRIGPIIGAHEYVVLTRWFGKPTWSESWRLGELSGFREEFSRGGLRIFGPSGFSVGTRVQACLG